MSDPATTGVPDSTRAGERPIAVLRRNRTRYTSSLRRPSRPPHAVRQAGML